jgi:hypothetical protein
MQVVSRFRLNEPTVVHEVIDGEGIIINLETGVYYSLNKSAAAVWERLAGGAGTAELVASLTEHYDASPEAIADDVDSLLDQLQQEQLIVPDVTATPAAPALEATAASAKKSYEPCRLQKFTDMTELLLLDPVHDVDEPGWPVKKPAGQAPGG